MIGLKRMGNVINFRKSYGIITAFPRVLGEKYDALGFLPAAAAALCGMCQQHYKIKNVCITAFSKRLSCEKKRYTHLSTIKTAGQVIGEILYK